MSCLGAKSDTRDSCCILLGERDPQITSVGSCRLTNFLQEGFAFIEMSTSSDLKEALSQRLKRMEASSPSNFPLIGTRPKVPGTPGMIGASAYGTGGNLSSGLASKGNLSPIRRTTSGLPPAASILTETELKSVTVDSVINCEGYLSKFSSGTLTGRWQKRFFVLKGGRFGYFKATPTSSEAKPEKSFSLKKIKEVVSKESASEREFSIRVGETLYPLKAPTPSDMRKWVSVLNTALAQKDSLPISDDDEDGSSSAVDMISVSNSVTSQMSDVSMMNEDVQAYLAQQRAMAASAARQHETVWEVDLDPDELEVFFSEWFPSFDEASESLAQLGAYMVTGLTKSISHLYSTLAGDIFDKDLTDLAGQYKRAKSVMQSVRKVSSSQGDPVRTQLNSVLIEYMPRIIVQVNKFLDFRKETRESSREEEEDDDDCSLILWKRSELFGILDILSLLMTDLSNLLGSAECDCSYCDPVGATSSLSENCTATERWKKSLRNCLQRAAGEFEVSLIERIQSKMLTIESTWDAAAGSSDAAPSKKNHSLFGSRLTVWLSAWAPSLVVACQAEGSDLLKEEAKLCHCNRLISEIVSAALVAVMNSAWRQFKRKSLRTNLFASQRKFALEAIAELREKNIGFWSVFSNGTTLAAISQLEVVPPEDSNTLELCNLLAFANEAVMLSVFLAETLPQQLPYIPKIFESCFDGLSATFANTSLETCRHVVHFHFVETNYDSMYCAFNPKSLSAEMRKTPMIIARDAVEKFAADLLPLGAHPVVKAHAINMLPVSVICVYLSGLLKNRIKVRMTKNLLSMIESDIIIFKSLFSESRFNCKESAVVRALDPLLAALSFLTEPRKDIIIEEISKRLLELLGPKHAPAATLCLMEMRGNDFSKLEKQALLALVDPQGILNPHNPKMGDPKLAHGLSDSDASWRF